MMVRCRANCPCEEAPILFRQTNHALHDGKLNRMRALNNRNILLAMEAPLRHRDHAGK